jgi:DNA repair protein RecO (recombination protein O)
MPARVSEAIVLQTYPFKESDLVVSFLTRDLGKLRGVAKRARRPKSNFGSGLERLSQVKMSYFQRETRELVNLDACEMIHSHFGLLGDYGAAVALIIWPRFRATAAAGRAERALFPVAACSFGAP